MEKLKENALNFILENYNQNGSLNNATHYYDYFDSIISLISAKRLSEARQILLYLSKYQRWTNQFEFEELEDDSGKYNSIYYLNCLSKYLVEVKDKNEMKFFSKILKKCIKSLKDYFNEEYLLFFSYDIRNKKWFINLENATYLSFADELSDLLNEFDYTKEADELFMLKGKVELGYQRYFFQKEMIIGRFSKDLEIFEGLRILEKWMLYKIYNIDKKIIENEINNIKKNKINYEDVLIKLNYLLTLKFNGEDISKLIKKDQKLLDEIPTCIYSKDFENLIYKSLFNKELTMKKIKSKIIIFNRRNRLRVAANILQL